MARGYDPRITIGVMLEFERMTGVKSLSDTAATLCNVTNLSALLYCAIRHQYPKLTFARFSEDLTPEDLGEAVPRLSAELTNFFQRLAKSRAETAAAESAEDPIQ